jgi:hypothetical protein
LKVLSRFKINYILLQMVALTFVCLMSFVDLFIEEDIQWLKVGILTFTVTIFVVYEIIVNMIMRKIYQSQQTNEEEQNEIKPYNEQFLWFEIMFFLDLIFIISVLTSLFKNLNLTIVIAIAFAIFYIITIILRPYFGIEHKKK